MEYVQTAAKNITAGHSKMGMIRECGYKIKIEE